jgi:hypothetical protein
VCSRVGMAVASWSSCVVFATDASSCFVSADLCSEIFDEISEGACRNSSCPLVKIGHSAPQ